MEKLTFGQGRRHRQTFKNGSTQVDRKYIDFIVSGQSLGQTFGLPDLDFIGVFGWTENNEEENKQLDEFLGKRTPELETGRTSFYVCPECGDIGCGAITAKIEITENRVIWKEFGYENNYSAPQLDNYKSIPHLEFDKTEYIETFEKLRRR
ncbi:MAG: hypothetical protein IPG39_21235 [Bacteroidetes bacterium]|nr:hypothetical protein [Bacteroidota bacterium]